MVNSRKPFLCRNMVEVHLVVVVGASQVPAMLLAVIEAKGCAASTVCGSGEANMTILNAMKTPATDIIGTTKNFGHFDRVSFMDALSP